MIMIDEKRCKGCAICEQECFMFCIRMEQGKAFFKGDKRCITCGHCIARCPERAIQTDCYDDTEIIEKNQVLKWADSEELLNVMKFRRSVRSYNKKIPDQKVIKHILEGARFAGTGGNRQPLRYMVIKDKRDFIVGQACEVLNTLVEKGGFYAPAYRRIAKAAREGRDELFYDAPLLVLVVGNTKKGFDAVRDGTLATAYIQLLCETQGLGSCINGFFGDAVIYGAKLRESLGLSDEECLVNAIGVGYPEVSYLRSVPRKELDITWM